MRHSPRCILVLWIALLTGALPRALAQNLRTVHDNTIISPELPKADLTFAPSFRYVGGQQVNLYGMADAEQHLFVAGDKNGRNVVVSDTWQWPLQLRSENRANASVPPQSTGSFEP